MPQYEIYVACKECGGEHPMRIRIHLDDGPPQKQSVEIAYQGKSRPPQLAAVERHKALCLRTGRTFIPASNDQIFLVPSVMRRFLPKVSD
ncbi:MAG TPA: hypothetical protein VNN77_05860 [candidate division Zixibacteria bacterium]|nr:hypothetical protein [candidate division Zixibacteria bacterium]